MGEHTQDMYGSQRTSSLFLGTELTGHQAWWQVFLPVEAT